MSKKQQGVSSADYSTKIAPKVPFLGGNVQILNPRLPITNVWCDLLHLEPNHELPAHNHSLVGSLLICLAGSGTISIGKQHIRLLKGVCVHIPAKAIHRVRSSKRNSLNCLSINQGIIDTRTGVDINFTNVLNQAERTLWKKFGETSLRKAKRFKSVIKKTTASGNLIFRAEV